MKTFLKMTLATITGLIIAGILFFVLMLSVFSAMVATGSKPVDIPEKSVLLLKTGVPIPDRTVDNPLSFLDPLSMGLTSATGLNDILKNLRKAAEDDNISGVLIENGVMQAGWATADELRNALQEFRKSGKFVYSYSDYVMMQESYFVSTAASSIWVNPTSMFDFKGLSAEVNFYKEALEKLGVEVQVIRHGKFKGAVEPYMLDKLSAENREQISVYMGSIWNHVTGVISESRNIDPGQINRLADQMAGYDVTRMKEEGFIDDLLYRDQMEDSIRSVAGIDSDKEINFVSMAKYSNVPEKHPAAGGKSKIALLFAEGNIVMGNGDASNIGGNRYAEELRKIRLDTTIKAVVFRVNSRGGNAIASDIIWREVELTSQVKPVVVSMGNYAASGGYYISAAADRIITSPVTITGSIGVFGLIPNVQNLLDRKIGISTDIVNTNLHSDAPSVTRPLTAYERDIIQANVERTYLAFTNVVASGRAIPQPFVDSIGQGRVWSGADAIGNGLADSTGGLYDAVNVAADLAGLEDYRLVERPEPEDIYTKLLNEMTGEMKIKAIRQDLGPLARYYTELKETLSSSGIQAIMPFYLDIH